MTIFFLILTRYRLLLDDWRGYVIAFFALVAVANVYMSSFARLRQEVKSEKLEAKKKEKELEEAKEGAATRSLAAGIAREDGCSARDVTNVPNGSDTETAGESLSPSGLLGF